MSTPSNALIVTINAAMGLSMVKRVARNKHTARDELSMSPLSDDVGKNKRRMLQKECLSNLAHRRSILAIGALS